MAEARYLRLQDAGPETEEVGRTGTPTEEWSIREPEHHPRKWGLGFEIVHKEKAGTLQRDR